MMNRWISLIVFLVGKAQLIKERVLALGFVAMQLAFPYANVKLRINFIYCMCEQFLNQHDTLLSPIQASSCRPCHLPFRIQFSCFKQIYAPHRFSPILDQRIARICHRVADGIRSNIQANIIFLLFICHIDKFSFLYYIISVDSYRSTLQSSNKGIPKSRGYPPTAQCVHWSPTGDFFIFPMT